MRRAEFQDVSVRNAMKQIERDIGRKIKTEKLRVFWVSEVGETDSRILGCNRGWDMEYNGNDFGMEWKQNGLRGPWSWLSRVGRVKFGDNLGCMTEFGCKHP